MSAIEISFDTPQTTKLQEGGSILSPKFDANGLISAIVSDHATGEILMLAHMNAEALKLTIETGESHFWSRSRQELWHKGATSGNIQKVQEIRIDCDQDAVLLLVKIDGEVSCHTGARSCFYRRVDTTGKQITLEPVKIVEQNQKSGK